MITAIVAASTTNTEFAFIVACVLLVLVGILRLIHPDNAVDGALVAFAAAAVVLGWILA